MEGLGINLVPLLVSTAAFAVVFLLAYRRYIFSIFDPLNVFLVANVFASVLMVNIVEDPKWWYQFFLFQAAFYFGFTRNKVTPSEADDAEHGGKPWFRFSASQVTVLEMATGLLFFISVTANLYMGATAGFPIFSDVPTQAKISMFIGGLGFVKRINGGLGVFIPCAALVLYAFSRHKRWWLFVVLTEAVILSLGGSKSAILSFVFMIAYLAHHQAFRNDATTRKLQNLLKVIFAFAVLWALIILYIESGTVVGAVAGLLFRAVMFADVIIWYYNPVVMPHFAGLGILDYIFTDLNPILGMFRIVPYQDPLGYTMIELAIGSRVLPTLVGPNVPFYIRSQIYFGLVGGCFYSMLVGYVVSFVRKLFFCSRNVGVIRFACLLTGGVLVFALPIDSSYFVSLCFDTFMPVSIVLAISYLVVSATRSEVYKPAAGALRARS